MVILAIDSSAVSASAAVVKDGKLLSEVFLNVGLTHSVTLLPVIRQAMEGAGVDASELDYIAVNNGPGSFTGVRIGVATAKGIAQPHEIKCIPVSTLEAIAQPMCDNNCIACAVMDARCNQVYCALFDCSYGSISRITQDEAISLDALAEKLSFFDKEIILIGDGADISYTFLKDKVSNISLSSPIIRFQKASGTAFAAFDKLNKGFIPCTAQELVPSYLRLSQAERELKKKKEN